MKHFVDEIVITTTSGLEFFDITEKVEICLKKSGIQNGFLTVFTQHTTTAVIVNEKEPKLQKDMIQFLNRIAPPGQNYGHDKNPQDGRLNAHSHLQTFLLPASQLIPFVEGKMKLGQWQKIFFIECDGPRPKRQLTIQVIGL
ncbi:MAG: YjbQ family protein [Deltaproteobacteria bacterium]|nr:YjbQ family protein [Deltaproteobacteria bacterium]